MHRATTLMMGAMARRGVNRAAMGRVWKWTSGVYEMRNADVIGWGIGIKIGMIGHADIKALIGPMEVRQLQGHTALEEHVALQMICAQVTVGPVKWLDSDTVPRAAHGDPVGVIPLATRCSELELLVVPMGPVAGG